MESDDRLKQIAASYSTLKRKIESLSEEVEEAKREAAALLDEEHELHQERELEAYDAQLKTLHKEDTENGAGADHRLHALILFLCDIRNHFNRASRWRPGKKGRVWTTIDSMRMSSSSPALRIRPNGDVYLPTGKAVRFNVFDVSLDKLKDELNLKLIEN
jgi:hypothetical protein